MIEGCWRVVCMAPVEKLRIMSKLLARAVGKQ